MHVAAAARAVMATRAGSLLLALDFWQNHCFFLANFSSTPKWMLKPDTSPKSPRIKLSNDRFAEWKCQVLAYKSETFHRRRSNGISHCENGEQNPPNVPFRLDYVDPRLIQQCFGPPQAPPQTAAPTVEALSHTCAVNCLLVTMARPKFASKNTHSRRPIPKPQYLTHPWTRPTYDANGIRIRSAVFPQCTGQADRRTDRPTERSPESLTTISLGRCAPRATRHNNN